MQSLLQICMYLSVVLFSFSLVVSVDRLKDVTSCGNKKVSSEDLRFDTRIKGLLKDYLVSEMIMICGDR